jgi:hypothetical protein
MHKFEFSRCLECGSICWDEEVQRVGDPSSSDGSLLQCPDCEAIEQTSGIDVKIQPGEDGCSHLAYFVDYQGDKQSPMKAGSTPEEARKALLDSYQLLI